MNKKPHKMTYLDHLIKNEHQLEKGITPQNYRSQLGFFAKAKMTSGKLIKKQQVPFISY